ncbi:DUF2829 domain-containing protein [Leminorella grimontii]|uniref:DUF2829 domain-containing protein n=1 Tax=Leminorella grimontii TaxID=82981 RepID=UPI00208CA6F5|nr:DUF2829 domain-containing protein [Leminorella grimontii]GKX60181.1 hypothetical protein SOASR031_24960 [Leminorella grimontii]
MHQYIGVKLINAKPMSRKEYNDFRGWTVPPDENGDDAGYLIEYQDGGKANTDAFAGYVSWSPKDVFEQAYRVIDGVTFGLAVEALKKGLKVSRRGWNGKGMWLILVLPPQSASAAQPMYTVDGLNERLLPYIAMRTADGGLVPWLASQTDVLSEDWVIE